MSAPQPRDASARHRAAANKLAQSRPKKHLTSATKSNGISITMPYWDERVVATAERFPDVDVDKYHIATSGAILWTRKFDRPLNDIALLQEDLVIEVAAHRLVANPSARYPPSVLEPVAQRPLARPAGPA